MPADDKSLVFTQYPSFDRLVPYLAERLGRKVGFFHGRLNARQRDELLTAFASEEPGGPTVLVISIRAGGRGLNLPAANHVFHFDRWWNPAVEQQATDRAHRLGQHKPVFVHSLICTGTLEERIDKLLDSKRELVEKVMAGRSEDWLGDLDLGAIRAAVVARAERRGGGSLMGPWSRSFIAAVAGNAERPELEVEDLRIEPGKISARVDGHEVTLTAAPIPQRIWTAMTRYAQGMGQLEDAVAGRIQSVHLEHLLEEDWDEQLIPRPRAIAQACACDAGAGCEHVVALAYAFGDEVEGAPRVVLRWRGVAEDAEAGGCGWR